MKQSQSLVRYGLLLLTIVPALLQAGDKLETDWLNAKKGSTGKALGAEVIEVKREGNNTRIDVKIPVKNIDNYETVVVIGKREKSEPVKPSRIKLINKPSWLHTDQNESYGLRFYVEGIPGFEFRIQLSSEEPKH